MARVGLGLRDVSEGPLVHISSFLLPEISIAAAGRDLQRATETAARVLVRERWQPIADVRDDDKARPTWRGLAACWARGGACRTSRLDAPAARAPQNTHRRRGHIADDPRRPFWDAAGRDRAAASDDARVRKASRGDRLTNPAAPPRARRGSSVGCASRHADFF
mmetsp:Transcript_16255/g.50448  ORF Transcript_16255/g.50448 Transcript_16255/m.50448 type:complete len:164 (+) Transcript_16255:186-677(+)